MDTSETYIKMCEKATEVQEAWKPAVGDWHTPRQNLFEDMGGSEWKAKGRSASFIKGTIYCAGSDGYDGFSSSGWCDWIGCEGDFSLLIWLPRQDQLQDMLDYYPDKPLPPHKLARMIWHYCELNGCPTPFTSMEQLWFALVMKEKYNKEWNGGDWVAL